MQNLERRWYRSSHDWVTGSLLPLSWVFRSIVSLRRFCYQIKLKKSYHFSAPVIVVGNITVGGTGKTPFVIWLAQWLKTKGYKPGIVSRGVGGKTQRAPRWVQKHADPKFVGDEALLLARKSECPVVIAIDRVAAVKELLAKSDCDIVISDDGLQHYRLGRQIEIAIVDGDRGFGNQAFLPAGPLRESLQRLQEVNFIIEQNSVQKNHEKIVSMQLQGDQLISLKNHHQKIQIHSLQGQKVHAVAAIGNPQRFFESLRKCGLELIEHCFPDHYLYQASDFQFNDTLPILMTEKDAVKCDEFADERFWFLPVEMQVGAQFENDLLKILKNNFTPFAKGGR
ncbi:MAG: tetraacyldisaccharide 4'-kinase [Gammaproteobacteria bacterium]